MSHHASSNTYDKGKKEAVKSAKISSFFFICHLVDLFKTKYVYLKDEEVNYIVQGNYVSAHGSYFFMTREPA